MKDTKILTPEKKNIEYAKDLILSGEVVGIPTETVYGLAANAFDVDAIEKIFKAKGRPQDNPLIVHICDMDMLKDITSKVSETALALGKKFWGGPLTMVLPKSDKIPRCVTAGLDTVAVRMPSHPVAIELIKACKVPIAAPSANLSGKPSPTTAKHVYNDLKGKIDCIIDGGECEVGVESTVIAVYNDSVEILRPGKITVDDLLEVVTSVKIDDGVFTKMTTDAVVSSPGMKYKHYSPNAKVVMVEGSISDFCDYVLKNADEKTGVLVFDGEESLFDKECITYGKENDSSNQASRIFDALREIDKRNLDVVYARAPKKSGVGMAVYNRLLRACGFEVKKLTKKPLIVGLTGQTGAGKSTLCDVLRQCGAAIIDCDIISREVIAQKEVLDKLKTYFGEEILNDNKTLNRKKLAERVFSEEENLIYLNSVMYPKILNKINRQIDDLTDSGYNIIILDAPTLFESGADTLCDKTISVISPVNLRAERIIKRDNLTEAEATRRINAQNDDEYYSSRSDYVIVNDKDQNNLISEAQKIFKSLSGL